MDEDIKTLLGIADDLYSLLRWSEDAEKLRAIAAKLQGKALIDPDELAELERDSETLAKLDAAGVDNWEGYSYAFENEEF